MSGPINCLYCQQPVEGVTADDLWGSEMIDYEPAHPQCHREQGEHVPDGVDRVIVAVFRLLT